MVGNLFRGSLGYYLFEQRIYAPFALIWIGHTFSLSSFNVFMTEVPSSPLRNLQALDSATG
jgi:hypothetical protein